MPTYRCRAGAALLLAPLVLAACAGEAPSDPAPLDAGGAVVAPSPAPPQAARLGVPFRNGSFEVTVTKVETGVRQLNISDAARSSGFKPWTPKSGQFVVVYLTAKNVDTVPTTCTTHNNGLVDGTGASYSSVVLEGGAPPVGQGLGVGDQPPGGIASGYVAFDVPASAGKPVTLLLQTKAYGSTTNAPTVVDLRS
jgi:hypothetical protein